MGGGVDYAAPVRVDPAVLAKLAALCPLARLHQPHNLAGIRAVASVQPDLPQVAYELIREWNVDTADASSSTTEGSAIWLFTREEWLLCFTLVVSQPDDPMMAGAIGLMIWMNEIPGWFWTG
jgi:Acetokinase family